MTKCVEGQYVGGGEQMMKKKFGLERKGKLTFVKVTSKFLEERTNNII